MSDKKVYSVDIEILADTDDCYFEKEITSIEEGETYRNKLVVPRGYELDGSIIYCGDDYYEVDKTTLELVIEDVHNDIAGDVIIYELFLDYTYNNVLDHLICEYVMRDKKCVRLSDKDFYITGDIGSLKLFGTGDFRSDEYGAKYDSPLRCTEVSNAFNTFTDSISVAMQVYYDEDDEDEVFCTYWTGSPIGITYYKDSGFSIDIYARCLVTNNKTHNQVLADKHFIYNGCGKRVKGYNTVVVSLSSKYIKIYVNNKLVRGYVLNDIKDDTYTMKFVDYYIGKMNLAGFNDEDKPKRYISDLSIWSKDLSVSEVNTVEEHFKSLRP